MEQRDELAFWERFARAYAPFMKSSAGVYDAVCRGIRPYLCREMDVLELACGSGQLSLPLSGRVHLWEATDFSPAMIEEAKCHPASVRLHFSVQDAASLPYGPETFDAVVIANALHIMPHPDRVMAEIRRVLRRGGLLFAPTFLHGKGRRLRVLGMKAVGFRTYHDWDEAGFTAYLESQGFELLEHRTISGGPEPLCFAAARNTGDLRREVPGADFLSTRR